VLHSDLFRFVAQIIEIVCRWLRRNWRCA